MSRNDDRNTRVEETIYFGNVYEAIYADFVTTEEILEYLLEVEQNKTKIEQNETEEKRNKHLLAYRIVCTFNEIQIVKGQHFLKQVNNDFYNGIYSLVCKTTDKDILSKCQKSFSKIVISDDVNYHFLYALCDVLNSDHELTEKRHFIVVAARSIKYLEFHDLIYNHIDYVTSDYLQPLDDLFEWDEYEADLLERCVYLKTNAPLYWKHVASELYNDLVKSKLDEIKFDNKEKVKLFHELFCFTNDKLLNRSNLALQLSSSDSHVKAYLLGFPIHLYTPSDDVLENCIDKLEEVGIDDYCNNLPFEINTFKMNDVNLKDANSENVHYDNISSFNAFDIIRYYSSSSTSSTSFTSALPELHVFNFTRSEFSKLLKDKKNFYTGEFLPAAVIEEIRSRERIASIYGLPESLPLADLLRKVEEGSICLDGDDEEDEEEEEEEVVSNPPRSIAPVNNSNVNQNIRVPHSNHTHPHRHDIEISSTNSNTQHVRKIAGRARDINGQIKTFLFAVPANMEDLDAEDMDNFLNELMAEQDMEYLGRICNHHIE